MNLVISLKNIIERYRYPKARWLLRNPFATLLKILASGKIRNVNLFEQRFDSENGEDGIIDLVFSKIGTTNKVCVEFGIAPHEGNTVYLRKKGWNCLWMDVGGDGDLIKDEFVTAENINELLEKYAIPEEFEILSIDVDYNDYWIWKAVENYCPKLVIIEYNSSIPVGESRTVPYDPVFHDSAVDNYWGASLLALQKLAETKGYELLACDGRGVNAFFLRKDLVEDHFELRPIEKIYRTPKFGIIKGGRYIGHAPSGKEMMPI